MITQAAVVTPIPRAPDIFQVCIAFTLTQEGGVSNDVHDPGGLTNRGLTLPDLQRFSRGATPADLLSLTLAETLAIYLALYWLPVAGWELPPSVAMMVFEHGVNAGIGDSGKLLQRAIGFTGDAVDGQIGRDTLHAVNTIPGTSLDVLLLKLRAAQDADYRSKANAQWFLDGWEARLALRYAAAKRLLPVYAIVETPTIPGASQK